MTRFLLKDGIQRQFKAFKGKLISKRTKNIQKIGSILTCSTYYLDGFDSVFNMESLKCFEPYEFQLLLSGDQAPSWTHDEIMNFTEPKLGYTKDR